MKKSYTILAWSQTKRYKVNEIALFNGSQYQNITGRNSSPDLLIDWVGNDSNFVHKTGNETIDGVKTFVSSPIVPEATDSNQAVNLGQLENTAIPYTGTTQPITGDLEFFGGDIGLFSDKTEDLNMISGLFFFESGLSMMHKNTITNNFTFFVVENEGIKVYSDNPDSRGIIGNENFSPNITDLDYTQKIYVDNAVTSGVSGAELQSNKNQNNGYCGLDSGGKVPIENLPTTLLKYQGVWNASTNTPTLTSPDTSKVGNVYNVSVAGTQFGINFGLGDWLIYNVSGVPEKSDNSDDVVSVNGQTGVVTITKSDVGLSNVDNTSDLNKPISTATQNAINVAAHWTKTGDNIRNNNTGNVEVRLNGKSFSIYNNLNQETARISDNGQYQILGSGGIFGNGSGCRLTFANNVFNFKSFAGSLTRFVFESDLFNTSGNVDVISFGTQIINPTSGNAIFNILDIDPVVNQTGGANGITRGILINPTLTSATDFRAIEIVSGKVIIPPATASNEAVNLSQLQNERHVYRAHDFLTVNGDANFAIASVAGGGLFANNTNATPNNPGIGRMQSFTNANSGVAVRSSGNSVVIKGLEVFNGIFAPVNFATIIFRIGIHDSISNADASNGVYFQYVNSSTLQFVTANNNVRTTTTISTLSLNTWYKVRFTVNANATSVLAELFDNVGVLVTSITHTTNIPITRLLNICAIATNSLTVATAMLDIDFIDLDQTLIR